MAMKFYTNITRELKLKLRTCLGLRLTIVEVAGEKLVEGTFLTPPPPPPLHPE